MPQYDDPLWTIIVLLVIVLAAVWANSREQSRRANGRSDPEKPKEDTSRSPDIKRPPDTYTSRTDANDRGNTEKAIRNWTMVLAIATAIGSVFALFTLNAIRGQLDEMQADQRPWLSVTVKPVGQMIFHDNKEVSISLSVISKNFGRSPARRIEIVPEIHAVTEKNLREVAYRLFQDHTCERAKLVSLDNRVGKTVFPTDTKEIQVGTLGEIP
jgi:hypothetical protein